MPDYLSTVTGRQGYDSQMICNECACMRAQVGSIKSWWNFMKRTCLLTFSVPKTGEGRHTHTHTCHARACVHASAHTHAHTCTSTQPHGQGVRYGQEHMHAPAASLVMMVSVCPEPLVWMWSIASCMSPTTSSVTSLEEYSWRGDGAGARPSIVHTRSPPYTCAKSTCLAYL